MISSTDPSLLKALKNEDPNADAWERFQLCYRNVILHWCEKRGLQHADAEDVTQRVLLGLYQKLPNHVHDSNHKFRSWLATVVVNAVRDFYRYRERRPDQGKGGSVAGEQLGNLAHQGKGGGVAGEQLAKLADSGATEEFATAIEQHVDPRLQAIVEQVKSRVGEQTWQAFYRLVVDNQPAPAVAEELAMSPGAVHQAKYRVSKLLEAEFAKINPE